MHLKLWIMKNKYKNQAFLILIHRKCISFFFLTNTRTVFWTVNFKKKLDFCLSEDDLNLQDAQMKN